MTDHKAEWVLVPRVPTDDMLRAAYPLHWFDGPGQRLKQDYQTMIAAAPAASEGEDGAVEMSPEFTDTARAALAWVLWHRQGGSSPVGQAIRFALGMGAHDRMRDDQVAEAKRWAALAQPEANRPAAQVAATAFDMLAHLQRQREWSGRTFGPGPRTAGVVDHIRKELREIEADPTDLSEWIDVVILALDGAWRAGGSPEQIIAALVAKQTKNEGRQWPDWRTADPDKAIEHDRSADAQVAATPKHDEGRDAMVAALNREADAHDYFAANADLRMTTGDHASRAKKIRAVADQLAALATQPASRRVTEADVERAFERWCDVYDHDDLSARWAAIRAALESFAQPAEGVSGGA